MTSAEVIRAPQQVAGQRGRSGGAADSGLQVEPGSHALRPTSGERHIVFCMSHETPFRC